MEKLTQSLGIENLFRSQGNEMTKGLNNQVNEFRNQSLSSTAYPVLWVDVLYEKVRIDGRIVNMAVLIVCEVDENDRRDIIAAEPMVEESRDSYDLLFQNLKERSLRTPKLVISDAHAALVSAIRESFLGASWVVLQDTFHAEYLDRCIYLRTYVYFIYYMSILEGCVSNIHPAIKVSLLASYTISRHMSPTMSLIPSRQRSHRHLKEQTKLVSSFLILLVSTKKIAVYVHVDYYSD